MVLNQESQKLHEDFNLLREREMKRQNELVSSFLRYILKEDWEDHVNKVTSNRINYCLYCYNNIKIIEAGECIFKMGRFSYDSNTDEIKITVRKGSLLACRILQHKKSFSKNNFKITSILNNDTEVFSLSES